MECRGIGEGGTMRIGSVRTITVALVAMLAATALAGCSDDTGKANASIDAANVKITEFNKLDTEIADVMGQIDSLGESEAEFAKGVELIDQATAKLVKRSAAMDAAKAEFTKIGSMDVSKELKTYATQQEDLAKAQATLDAKVSEMLGKLKEMFNGAAAGTMDEATATKLGAELDALSGELDALQKQIDDKQAASEKYFKDKALGE
jgi:hypothetical protein